MSLRQLVENMPQERAAWHKFGVRLMAVAAALAFSVWATVRCHPERDLPLWPAYIFAALSCVELGLSIATTLHLPPFRASSSMSAKRAAVQLVDPMHVGQAAGGSLGGLPRVGREQLPLSNTSSDDAIREEPDLR